MTTALIADDEPLLRDELQRLLELTWPELDIIGVAGTGREALALADEHHPDIAFLDIRMPGMSGLEVAGQLSAQTRIVFVTAYDHYAIEAFEAAAVDYLLKPLMQERIALTVARLKMPQLAQTEVLQTLIASISQNQAPKYLQWFRVGHGEITLLIDVDDALVLKADHKYTTVVTRAKEHVLRTSIKTLEAQLDPEKFWRVHRSIIVNINAIEQASRDLRGRYVLTIRGHKKKVRTSQAYGYLFKHM